MRLPRYNQPAFWLLHNKMCPALGAVAIAWLCLASAAYAASSWDSQALTMGGNAAGSGTQWWFDAFNWSGQNPAGAPPYYLPPMNENGAGVADVQINTGTSSLPGGEGVVYIPQQQDGTHPDGDPNFTAAGDLTYPAGFGRQHIAQLYISRAAQNTLTTPSLVPDNLLTIKGDLEADGPVQVGRSSGMTGVATFGRIVQVQGTVKITLNNLDLGQNEQGINTGRAGYGHGTYDYRSGVLEVGQSNGGLRLASESSGGPSGVGRFIMHNPGPTSPGYVKAYDLLAPHGDGVSGFFADGVNTGVGIVEFHSNGAFGTRPIQVNRNLVINNGSTMSGGIRSARLALILDAAPTLTVGVPQDLGLFDVAFSDATGTNTTGSGNLGDFFSSANGSTLYNQGATVSAIFGGIQYNWTISYTGNITWSDATAGTVGSIGDTGGVDVVLKGLSSATATTIPGDYNNNGVVDGADYVVWRDNERTTKALPNDPYGPVIGASQYNLWRANFGKTPGTGAGSMVNIGAVPEPSAMVLILGGLISAALVRRRS